MPNVESIRPFEPKTLRSLLWRLRRPYRNYMFWRILSVVAVTPFPIITQQIIDKGVGNKDLVLCLVFAGVSIALLVLHMFSMKQCVMRLSDTTQSLLDLMRGQIFSKLQFMNFGFLDSTQTGRLLSKYAFDTQNVELVVVPMMFGVVPELVRSALLAIALTILNPWTVLFFLLSLPVVVVARVYFLNKLTQTNEDVRVARERLTGHASEFISAIKLVRGFGQEQPVEQSMGSISEKYSQSRREQMFVSHTLAWVMFAIISIIDILVVAAGSILVIKGQLTLGTLAAMLGSLPIILGPVNTLTQFGILYMQGQASYTSIKELMDSGYVERWRGKQIPTNLQGQIDLADVSFRYDKTSKDVLKNISLSIKPGKHVAFVGASGSGKSTLVNLILGLYSATEGVISVDGIPQKDLDMKAFRQRSAIVMQDNLLLSGTLLDNLRFARPEATVEEVIDAAKTANAWEFIETLPHGLDTRVGERGVSLSGGQRQRIAIARAILRDPVLLILDEATSALDNESEGVIQEALERITQHRTTLTIAHRLSTVRKADTVVVFKHGTIVERGSYEELANKPGGEFANLLSAHHE